MRFSSRYVLILAGMLLLAGLKPFNLISQDRFSMAWDKVSALEEQGKPRSAIAVVDSIYAMAIQGGDNVQMIKALEYGIRLLSKFEEDPFRLGLDRIRQELPRFAPPATQVLHALEAELYLAYYSTNRHLILDRTPVGEQQLDDMATWDQLRFAEAIFDAYARSLEDPGVLQRIPSADYSGILKSSDTLYTFRPTLYDILAHNALEFYKNDEFMASRPATRFEIDKPVMIDIAEAFADARFTEKEAYSMKYHALKLYRDLVTFHLEDDDPSVLVDIDLQRLAFVKEHAIFDDAEEAYQHTLEQMESLYLGHEAVAEVYYHLALIYNEKGQLYKPGESDDHQRDLLIAARYCKNAIQEFPGSYGSVLCENLLRTIEAKSLLTNLEYANLPARNILVSLQFRNVGTVFARIVSLDPDEALLGDNGTRNTENEAEKYRKLRPQKHWAIELPKEIDHHEHITEFAIPPLTEGYYGLMVSDNPAFDEEKGVVHINNFWVTGISYISTEDDDGSRRFYVLHRESGKAIDNAAVKIFTGEYDPQSRQNRIRLLEQTSTGNDGAFILQGKNNTRQWVLLEISKGADRFIGKNKFYLWPARDNIIEKTSRHTKFFTDRSIYRPGQTIYFKGILLEQQGDSHMLMTNTPTKVQFFDANNQLLASLDLQSNEYGSVHGAFTAPTGALTGMMRIQNETGNTMVSVEEYKRPRFEVVFDTIAGSYRLGETVRVSGKALAYSGQAIDHAGFRYRVVRTAFWPYPLYRGGWPVYSAPAEIASGNGETGENGIFSLSFTAIPDRDTRQMFNYAIYVDVTDRAGETHSAEQHVNIGKQALILSSDIPAIVDAKGNTSFALETNNPGGKHQDTRVDVTISKLKSPGTAYQEPSWRRQADVKLLSEEKFREMFPQYPYNKENDPAEWEKSATVLRKQVNTGEIRRLELPDLASWDPGEYLLEFSATDEFGEKISVKQYFTLYNPSSGKLPRAAADWFVPITESAEPGETAKVVIGSSYHDVNILFQVRRKDKPLEKKWISLNNEQRMLEIPVGEGDRGGIWVNLLYIKNNQSYGWSQYISVPYTNKQLDISIDTFRDKLLPGQKESWNIRIRSVKGEKVVAELLAGMYDASLDAFRPHGWQFAPWNFRLSNARWEYKEAFMPAHGQLFMKHAPYKPLPQKEYAEFYWKGIYLNSFISPYYKTRGLDVMMVQGGRENGTAAMEMQADGEFTEDIETQIRETTAPPESKEPFQPRRNLQETAFFFPQLATNAEGEVVLSFTTPESLTRWKLLLLAHTKDLGIGLSEKELITRKELMVVPNPPRYFREGDEVVFSATVVNLSARELNGRASLQFFDAVSMQPLESLLPANETQKPFKASKGNSNLLSWTFSIPEGLGPVVYRVTATAGSYSDGEEMMVPVLSNRILVTESMPLPVKGGEKKDFIFSSYIEISAQSKTLSQHAFTLEFTENPAWYAVQALPYLMETGDECSEKIYSRVYANSLAAYIIQKNPGIRNVFESWKSESPDAFLSKLEKNQDLKNALLSETPWVLQAGDESERKKRIALLFDLNRMDNELQSAISTLSRMQLVNGGWPWFSGGRDSRYITQLILSGFGKLYKMGVLSNDNTVLNNMLRNAVSYADERMYEAFEELRKDFPDYRDKDHLDRIMVQYLYARSFLADEYMLLEKHKEAFLYAKEQAKKYWPDRDHYTQAMIALALHRLGDKPQPAMIMASIREHALSDDEMGMYWRKEPGFYWYEAPVETQALMIEAFDEILKDKGSVEAMKTWLLKQKQTSDWKTSRATADAVYALLLRGRDLLAPTGGVQLSMGGQEIDIMSMDDVQQEAGSGYFRKQWNAGEMHPEMGEITVKNNSEGIAWGAVYWQYFEDLDKIGSHASPLHISKQLFVEENTAQGPMLRPLKAGSVLKAGDRVVSRIEIRTDRDMEFVHLKDMRAAAFEPEESTSGYRWQGGLGYYESISDASVNFFISYLPKGTWVFESPMFVTQRGTYSNGITSIQCMYAPEFSSHSEGIRVVVE